MIASLCLWWCHNITLLDHLFVILNRLCHSLFLFYCFFSFADAHPELKNANFDDLKDGIKSPIIREVRRIARSDSCSRDTFRQNSLKQSLGIINCHEKCLTRSNCQVSWNTLIEKTVYRKKEKKKKHNTGSCS